MYESEYIGGWFQAASVTSVEVTQDVAIRLNDVFGKAL